MNYKILEANGVENENVDGGAFNNFCAGGKSGIVADVLNECNLISQGKVVTVSTGLLLLQGIRVKLLAPEDFSLSGNAGVDTPYYIVAKVVLSADRSVLFDLFLTTEQTRTQENLYKNNFGTYELEIGRFIHATSGSIKNLRRTAQIIKQNDGGSSSGLTEEEKAKLDKLIINGTGDKFLANNGEYKEVSVGTSLDVQINGTSIVENGIANVPIAGINGKLGVVFVHANSGTAIATNGRLYIVKATESQIKAKGDTNQVIAPQYLEYAVKAGLIPKSRYTTEEYAALLTLDNTWTPEEQAAAQQTLGISSGTQLYKHELIMDRTTDEYGDEFFYKIVITLPTSQVFEIFNNLIEYLVVNGLQGLFRMYYTRGNGTDVRAYYNLINGGYHTNGYDLFPHCTKMEEGIATIISLQDFITSGKAFEGYTPIPLQGE